MIRSILGTCAIVLLTIGSPASAQRAYTAQDVANGAGIVYKKEIRQKVVQGPTMTFRDVGKGNIGYMLWGYMSQNGPYFRLVGLPYRNMRQVTSVRFEGHARPPEFTPQKRLVNVQMGFGIDVYRKALSEGLTVHLTGDVEKTFTVPKEYFQGYDAWWRKTYN